MSLALRTFLLVQTLLPQFATRPPQGAEPYKSPLPESPRAPLGLPLQKLESWEIHVIPLKSLSISKDR